MPSLSEVVLAYLPYLRRYARALTGSQAAGDARVRRCLEGMLADPQRLDRDADLRVEVFAAFHRECARLDAAPRPAGHLQGDLVAASLSALPPLERQALLLVSLEEFTLDQAARILDLGADRVGALVAQARAGMGQGPLADILIIEDDPIIALDIAGIVRDMGFAVTGVAARRDQAIELAAARRPNLVLADVQLAEGDDGIGTVQEILRSITVPVVFVTGHPERVLTGEGLEPAFVISKPYEPGILKTAIDQALMPRAQA